ncbi:MAG TPA: hypothetical protein VFB38_15085 [Chthonomonadaceae bacterium]|nr:hypothetical protein [Chthonomonadaceae bacterium]
MNARGTTFFAIKSLQGRKYPQRYRQMLQEYQAGIPKDTVRSRLAQLLAHCRQSVPYYAEAMRRLGDGKDLEKDPERCLQALPILTKDTIRDEFERLKSADLASRKWVYNTSGGSTGEPVKIIQDVAYEDWSIALIYLYYHLAGYDVGEPVVYLWGSERDLFAGTIGWQKKLSNFLTATTFMNAFRMEAAQMRAYLDALNRKPPKMIVAYAQAIYELARFAQAEGLRVAPQNAITASAGTLHPFMRETIETVFQARIFNRYGCREVGNIASEIPGVQGLWVAPWNNYVEIVDDEGCPVPPGVEGNILVTSLTNYAMPLLRYRIGDCGALAPGESPARTGRQVLQKVTGRMTDNFRTRTGRVIPGEYFTHLLGVVLNGKGAIKRFQLTQRDYDRIEVKIVRDERIPDGVNTAEVIEKVALVMEKPCAVTVDFVEDIPSTASGKYRFTISEVR